MHFHSTTHKTTAKHVLRYLKGSILWLSNGPLTLQAFCDSDWARAPDDRRSTSGYGVFLGSCLILWSAKK